jgi:hypothetical protein
VGEWKSGKKQIFHYTGTETLYTVSLKGIQSSGKTRTTKNTTGEKAGVEIEAKQKRENLSELYNCEGSVRFYLKNKT